MWGMRFNVVSDFEIIAQYSQCQVFQETIANSGLALNATPAFSVVTLNAGVAISG
jgi:hypothetical protein